MAIHKQNNYTSPEVVTVDFKMEKGFGDSFKVGEPKPQTEQDYGTQQFNTMSTSGWLSSQSQG